MLRAGSASPGRSVPRPRDLGLAAFGLLLGVLGGWTAGLLRVPRSPR